tara:strand:+ start:104 stop:403 length:300 start_codon:yes stop_codon:yes gene_type:complete
MNNNKTTFNYIPCKIQLEGSAFSTDSQVISKTMTKMEELMEAGEAAEEYADRKGISYADAFRHVWEAVWYDEDGEVRDRPVYKGTMDPNWEEYGATLRK